MFCLEFFFFLCCPHSCSPHFPGRGGEGERRWRKREGRKDEGRAEKAEGRRDQVGGKYTKKERLNSVFKKINIANKLEKTVNFVDFFDFLKEIFLVYYFENIKP